MSIKFQAEIKVVYKGEIKETDGNPRLTLRLKSEAQRFGERDQTFFAAAWGDMALQLNENIHWGTTAKVTGYVSVQERKNEDGSTSTFYNFNLIEFNAQSNCGPEYVAEMNRQIAEAKQRKAAREAKPKAQARKGRKSA